MNIFKCDGCGKVIVNSCELVRWKIEETSCSPEQRQREQHMHSSEPLLLDMCSDCYGKVRQIIKAQ